MPALLVLLVFFGPGVAVAYRPFVSTDAAVAGPGEAEVEFGYIGFRRDEDRTAIVVPTVIGNLGLARGLELVTEFKLVTDLSGTQGEDRTRFEDTAISLKWIVREGALQEHGPAPSLAVELSLLLPAVRGEDRPGGELVGIASGIALGWTYHVNGGAPVEPGSDEPGLLWGFILEHQLRGRLRAVAEVNGESVRGSAADNSALVGAIWEVTAPAPFHDLSLDIGVRHAISHAADEWGGTAGFTFAFPWRTPSDEGRTP